MSSKQRGKDKKKIDPRKKKKLENFLYKSARASP